MYSCFFFASFILNQQISLEYIAYILFFFDSCSRQHNRLMIACEYVLSQLLQQRVQNVRILPIVAICCWLKLKNREHMLDYEYFNFMIMNMMMWAVNTVSKIVVLHIVFSQTQCCSKTDAIITRKANKKRDKKQKKHTAIDHLLSDMWSFFILYPWAINARYT